MIQEILKLMVNPRFSFGLNQMKGEGRGRGGGAECPMYMQMVDRYC